MRSDVNQKIKEIIALVAMQQGMDINTVEDHHAVVDDLGFKSLDVATLTALFEEAFKVNPFTMGIAAITEIRTVAEITQVYEEAIATKDAPETPSQTRPVQSRASARQEARNRRRKA